MSTEEKFTVSDRGICLHRWENYPLDLPGYDAAEVDLVTYHDRLCRDMTRLVGEFTEVNILTVGHSVTSRAVIKTPNKDIRNTRDLKTYLTGITELTSIFFSVQPSYSFGKLKISEEALKTLLTHFRVHPGFLDVLHLFGEKTQEENEDFGIYKQYITKEYTEESKNQIPGAFELCYNLKHVEPRQDINNPDQITWATRKMGVYSKFYTTSGNTTWILLQPSRYTSNRLEEVSAKDSNPNSQKRRHDFDIHVLLLWSASRNWTPYINDLEQDLKNMDNKAFVEFEDAQRIQRLKDTLLQLSHSLDINCDIISSLKQGLQIFQKEGWKSYTYGTTADFHKCNMSLDLLLTQTGQQKNRVQYLIRRTDGLSALIPYMFAQRENSVMLKLSEKGTQYARSMKVITVFTMIYLPPSFVASFFGIRLFDQNSKGGITLAPEVVYYFVATGILMTLTFGGWMLWERMLARKTRARARARAHDEEKAHMLV